jgi:hypothetical protein
MARFTQKTKQRNITKNYEGANAYKISAEMELYTAVCTSVLSPKFYTPDNGTEHIRELIQKVPPEFVASLAVYVREKMYLRSIPLVLLVELARIGKLKAETVGRVIQRPDEITELLGYYQLANERTGTKKLNKLSAAIYWGLKKYAFNKFDEYQFAKYNRKTEIRLRDAIMISHPIPRDEKQSKLFKKILDDTLEVPYTWETQLSEAGQQKERDKKEVWQELIESKKVGYMALLRNLRNILQANVSSKHIKDVCEYLSDKEAVENSKQLPFRFLSAYRELKNVDSSKTSYVLESLEKAVQHSAKNIRGYDLDTTVLIACDVSGSMKHPISKNSSVQYYDIGLVLGMLLQSQCESVISGMFGEDWKVLQLPRTSILSNSDEMHRREGEVGYATNGWKVLNWCIKHNEKIDKIMMFTDCQMWDSTKGYRTDNLGMLKLWNEYKKINPDAKLYLFDLAGHGNTPLDIRRNDVYLIAGWSDKIFDVLSAIEKGVDVLTTIKS